MASGHWTHAPKTGEWQLLSFGAVDITISEAALDELCQKTGWSRREALAWVATRPSAPPPTPRE
jgi:hypothetical protein